MPSPQEMAVNRAYDQSQLPWYARVWSYVSGSAKSLEEELEGITDRLQSDIEQQRAWLGDFWGQLGGSDGDPNIPPVVSEGPVSSELGRLMRSSPYAPALVGIGLIGVVLLVMRK